MRSGETTRRSVGLGTALMAALAVCWPAVTANAQPARPGPSAFGESVDVQLINVEVWVTDRQGNAVTGLAAEDFEVREDGKPVEISNFSEIRSALLPSSPPWAGVPVEEPAKHRPLELKDLLREDAQEKQQAGFLVLYFDELFSGPTGRQQLIKDLRSFVEQRRVPPEKVLVLRQDKDLSVLANLGSTRSELEAALDSLEKTSSRGAQTWADEKSALRQIQGEWESVAVLGNLGPGGDPCDFFPDAAFREIQYHVNVSRARIAETLGYLTNTASFLAGLPGPKTLVYVSDGLATTPGTDLMSFALHLCPDRQGERRLDLHEGLNEAFVRLSRHANANRVTFYTLQASGTRQQVSLTSAEQKGVRNTVRALSRFDSESRTVHRQGLFLLAEETGGRAVVNRNTFLEELEQIADDMSGYYSLAYVPPHDGDGLDHRIDVRVRGDKVRVRHRPGYRDKSLDQRMIERLESTLFLNLMANPMGVSLGAGQVAKGEGDKSTVALHVRVPVDRITFLPGKDGDMASLKVQVMARDERNRRSAFKQEVYRLARPPDATPEQRVSLVLHLELGEGIHVVAFGIHDEATKEASFVATALEILGQPAAAEGGR